MVALLRGINVGGNKTVPMADLRAIVEKAGFNGVSTFINSGNVIFEGSKKAAEVEAALEGAIEKRFKFEVPVIVRTAEQWAVYAKGTPFKSAQKTRAKAVQLCVAQGPIDKGALALLREKATTEKVELAGDAFWIYYPAGIPRSKLSPALLDRAAGSPVTARNWNTVLTLAELLGS